MPPITLTPLPYAKDALEPYMSAETLEYHHDKHHRSYVDALNRLLANTSDVALNLRDIIRSRLAAGDDRQLPALEAALARKSDEPAVKGRLRVGPGRSAVRVSPAPVTAVPLRGHAGVRGGRGAGKHARSGRGAARPPRARLPTLPS